MRELKEINDKKLQKQLEIILQQIMDQENLEERITLKQPEIQIRQTVKTLEEQLPKMKFIQKQKDEEEKIDYSLFEGEKNYSTGVELNTNIINDPLENNPNKPLEEITPYKENTDAYQTQQESFNIQTENLDESNKDFSTESILKRKKSEQQGIMYKTI
ncbi:hypothetical protein HON86_02040 [Candidatus Woesearchaeota archaeon]|nr:hypothetical protein [Candidatus Woesearchaeota archaeon]